jgi:hypothetical protein
MGNFFKELGAELGGGVGAITKGLTTVIADATGIKHIKTIGNSAARITERTGAIIGNFADGVVEVGSGIINQDKKQGFGGAEKIIDTTAQTLAGVASGVVGTAKTVGTVVSGVYEKNQEKVIKGVKGIATIAAVGALSVGVFEIVDGIEDIDLLDDGADEFVSPHWVSSYTRGDGTSVDGYWRDGDGDTTIDLGIDNGGGFMRNG